ncbi:hypothetical protein HNR34_002328 [Geobacillus subterraneus]
MSGLGADLLEHPLLIDIQAVFSQKGLRPPGRKMMR